MNAAYRLMGNFPSRGFGDSLSSADFTSGASIVSGTDARLPMSGAPRTRAPRTPGEVTEAYHAYEIHPLSFGQLTVMYSATGAMMQANGAATRPCSYTNAVTRTGEDVPAYVSSDEAMCSMLRYNDFVTLQELWVLPKDVSILPSKPWVEDASLQLDYDVPAPVSDEMLRSLLIHYWRAASLQFFGPWDSGKRMFCLYRDDLLMQHIANRDRTFTVCISRENDCQTLVPQAKGFLWQMILKHMPRQIRNITSVAAAVPQQHARSLYRDAAMCVVYPSNEAMFDFNNGKFPVLEADEDRFMQQVLAGNLGVLLGKMHTRYAALTGKMLVDECPFMADYDLALALYRLENAKDDWNLLANWYAVLHHLNKRHEIREDLAASIMQDVDEFVAARVEGREGEIARMLTSQVDRNNALMAVRLQSFLWGKAVYAAGTPGEIASHITMLCQSSANAVFFPELPAAQEIPENENALQRMALLVSRVLNSYHMEERLTDEQVKQLLQRVTPVYRQSKPLFDAVALYLVVYQDAHPADRVRLLPLSAQYLDADEQTVLALKFLTDRLDSPATAEECESIRGVWPLLKDQANVQEELNAYIVALYVRYYEDLAVVTRVVTALGADATGALVAVFTTEPGCSLRLNEQTFNHVLGKNKDADCILASAKRLPEVQRAYRAYLTKQLERSVHSGESLYNWCVGIINRSLPTRLYVQMPDRKDFLNWCAQLVMDYTLDYAMKAKQLPAEESFERMLKLAKEKPEDKPTLFAQYNAKVLEVYEELLKAEAPNAERQTQRLAPYLTGVRSGTLVQQVTGGELRKVLQNELRKDKHFWDVLNDKWDAQSDEKMIGYIQRIGILPKQLFDQETQRAAVNCIHKEMASIAQPQDYYGLFENYAAAEQRFKYSVSIADIQTDATISVMWHEVAKNTFMEQLDGFFRNCSSIEAAGRLLDVAENPVGVRKRAEESITGKIICCLLDVQNLLNGLPDETRIFGAVVDKAVSLRTFQSEKALRLVHSECDVVLNKETNFIRRAGVALLRSVVFKGYNWRTFLLKLAPEMDNMMHAPYASGSLPLLHVISCVLRLFEKNRTQDNLLQVFVQYLKTDANMAPYTAAIRKDQKAMAQFFPGFESSASLKTWLRD